MKSKIKTTLRGKRLSKIFLPWKENAGEYCLSLIRSLLSTTPKPKAFLKNHDLTTSQFKILYGKIIIKKNSP